MKLRREQKICCTPSSVQSMMAENSSSAHDLTQNAQKLYLKYSTHTNTHTHTHIHTHAYTHVLHNAGAAQTPSSADTGAAQTPESPASVLDLTHYAQEKYARKHKHTSQCWSSAETKLSVRMMAGEPSQRAREAASAGGLRDANKAGTVELSENRAVCEQVCGVSCLGEPFWSVCVCVCVCVSVFASLAVGLLLRCKHF
jgi:hypothetical protein